MADLNTYELYKKHKDSIKDNEIEIIQNVRVELPEGKYKAEFKGQVVFLSFKNDNKDKGVYLANFFVFEAKKDIKVAINDLNSTLIYKIKPGVIIDLTVKKINNEYLPFIRPYIKAVELLENKVFKFKDGRKIYIFDKVLRIGSELWVVYQGTDKQEYSQFLKLDSDGNLDLKEKFNIKYLTINRALFEKFPANPWQYPYPYRKIKENKVDNLPSEKWFEIPDYNGRYEISNYGRVKSKFYSSYDQNEKILVSNFLKLYNDGFKSDIKRGDLIKQIFSLQLESIPDKSIIIKNKEELVKILTYSRFNKVWFYKCEVDEIYRCFFLNKEKALETISILIENGFEISEGHFYEEGESQYFLKRNNL